MIIDITDEIRCSEERYWALYLDPAFVIRLLTEGLGYTDVRVLRNEPGAGGLRRDLVMTPPMDLPGPVRKIIGPSTTITEEGRFDEATRVWKWTHRLSVLSDKFDISGTMRVSPAGAGVISRHSQVSLVCRVFGIGGLVESAAAGNVRTGFAAGADFINRELARTPQS
jgi:hypothetical protein